MAELADTLRRRPELLLLLLAGYFLLQIAVRLALPAAVELDEGQQLFYMQHLAAGYDTQPPFYNWLQYGVGRIFGPTVLSLTLLKNAMLFAAYAFYAGAAGLVLKDRGLAIVATLGLLTIPQVSFEAQRDLSHTVALIFATSLFLFAFLRTLQRPTAAGYLLTGVAAGIGVISKYNFALLPAAAAIAALCDPVLRRRVLDPRILLTAAAGAAVVLPHGLWFLDNIAAATEDTIGKMTTAAAQTTRLGQIATGLGSLALALAGFSALTLVLFLAMFGRDMPAALKAQSRWTRLVERMVLVIVVALAGLVLFAGASYIKDRWLTCFLLVLPLYLCLKLEAAGVESGRGLVRSLAISAAIAVLVAGVLAARPPLAALTGKYQKLNVPYGPAIEAILAANPGPPAVVVVDETQLAGAVRLHADVPVVIPRLAGLAEPDSWDAARPVLLLWRGAGEPTPLPAELKHWLDSRPELADLPFDIRGIALPYHYGRKGDLYSFQYVWLQPPAP